MHIAYGAGSFGENIAYNFFYLYFIYFLTNTVKLDPAIAGIISLIAVSWDGITDPFLGYVSDNLNSKFGRRRPMMIVFCIPLGISLFLLFTNPDLSAVLNVIYFIVLNIIFWFCFTAVDIPYIALGAELTDNFNERTKLRAVAQVFLSLGVIVISFTLVFVDFFTGVTGNRLQIQ